MYSKNISPVQYTERRFNFAELKKNLYSGDVPRKHSHNFFLARMLVLQTARMYLRFIRHSNAVACFVVYLRE